MRCSGILRRSCNFTGVFSEEKNEMQGGEITYLKFQSKLVGGAEMECSLQGGFSLSCYPLPQPLEFYGASKSSRSLPSSSVPASLKRALRVAHNTQPSFLTNTLMVQHCLLAAISSRVGGKCTNGNSRELYTMSLAHSQEATTSQTITRAGEVAHLGFWVSTAMSVF